MARKKKSEQEIADVQSMAEETQLTEAPKTLPRSSYWLSKDLPPCPTATDIDAGIDELHHAIETEHKTPLEVFGIQVSNVVVGHLPEANPDRYRNTLTILARPIQPTTTQDKSEQP